MRQHHSLSADQDANAAGAEAIRGAGWGAAKWGVPFAAFWVIGNQMSPVYRGLTFQFKVFIQMSGMVLGGYLEADKRVRLFEHRVRLQKRAERDHAYWRRWEGLVEEGGKGDGDGDGDGVGRKK